MRTPKKPKEATTPGGSTGAGRKKTKSTLNREAILGTPTKSTGSATGKRGRKGRAESLQEDDDDDYQENTPSKKQKSYGLRPITNEPKYTQEMAAGEGDEDDESLLAPEDDGDYEYQEDGIGENDDMEGVQEQKGKLIEDHRSRSSTNLTQQHHLRRATPWPQRPCRHLSA